jgi:Lsr2
MGTFLARYVMTRLVDDIDGSQAVTTVSFSLDGHSYEIDLSESHLSALQEALAPFVNAARVVPGGRREVRIAASNRAPEPKEQVEVREVIAAETPAVSAPPFQQANPAAAPPRPKPAPLVADPFNPRS